MTYAAISIVAWGAYAIIAGLALFFMPNTTLAVLGFEPTNEHWILIVALLMMGFGLYYLVLGATEVKQFFVISAFGRTAFFVVTTALVLMGKAPTSMLIFGVVDLVTAVWTCVALRVDKRQQVQNVLQR